MRNSIFIGLLSVTLLSGCSWFGSKEGVAIMSPLPKIDNQFQPTTVWSHSVGSGSGKFYSNLHPIWQNNYVFAADRCGVVKALDLNSGKEIWSTNLAIHTGLFSSNYSAQLSGGIASTNSRIYVGSELAKVYALEAQDGRIAWETTVAGEALSTPVISNGIVLIHTSNGMLQALNEIDGTLKWTVSLDASHLKIRGESSPTITLGAAIIGSDNGWVSAITINHGELIWRKRISKSSDITKIAQINDVKATPVVDKGIVYALAYNGNLVALDLQSGQMIWSLKIGSVTNLLVDNGKVYLVDRNDCVISVDTQGGIILWRQSRLLHRNLTSPVLYNDYIIAGDSEGYLHWININNGCLVAQQKVDNSGFLATPIVAGNKLIVQAKNGEVYAIIP